MTHCDDCPDIDECRHERCDCSCHGDPADDFEPDDTIPYSAWLRQKYGVDA